MLGNHADGWTIKKSDPVQYRVTYHIESTQDASSTNFTCALPNKHRSSATTFSTTAALIEMGPEAAGVKAIIAGLCPVAVVVELVAGVQTKSITERGRQERKSSLKSLITITKVK